MESALMPWELEEATQPVAQGSAWVLEDDTGDGPPLPPPYRKGMPLPPPPHLMPPVREQIMNEVMDSEPMRVAGRTARTGLTGAAMVADIPGMFLKAGTDLGYDTAKKAANIFAPDLASYMQGPARSIPLPSEGVKGTFDNLTGGKFKPQNKFEKAIDTAGEYVAAVATGGIANKAAGLADDALKYGANTVENIMQRLAPKATRDLTAAAGAGYGQEYGGLPGAVAGAVVGGKVTDVPNMVKNAVMPAVDDALRPLAKKAMDMGIPLSGSQVSDSKVSKLLSSTTGKVPFSGAESFARKQHSEFTRQIAKTIGADTDKITPEIVDNAYRTIGNKFNKALGGQTVKVTDDVLNRLAKIESEAADSLTADQAQLVNRQLGKFLKDLNPDGTISGEKINSFRSQLVRVLRRTRNDANSFLGDLDDLVTDVAVDGSATKRELLNEARRQYKALKTIEPLAAKASESGGTIQPSLLQGRVMAQYKDYARGGGGELGDLARIGQAFLKDKIPDSGTAQRLAAYTGLFGTGGAIATGSIPGVLPGVLAGMGTSAAYQAKNNAQPLVKAAINSPVFKNSGSLPTSAMGLLTQDAAEQSRELVGLLTRGSKSTKRIPYQ